MSRKNISDLEVLKTYASKNYFSDPIEELSLKTGECYKVCYRAVERTLDRGYLEYGVSLRCAWLTEEGMSFIKSKELL